MMSSHPKINEQNKKTGKVQDVEHYLQQKRLERMEKQAKREMKVRAMKLQKVKSLESLNSGKRQIISTKDSKAPIVKSKAPTIRQTLTSQKRIDKVNLNTPEYEKINERFKEILDAQMLPKCYKNDLTRDNKTEINAPVDKCEKTDLGISQTSQKMQNDDTAKLKFEKLSLEENLPSSVTIDYNNKASSDNKSTTLLNSCASTRRQWTSPKPISIDEIPKISNDIPANTKSSRMRRSISSIHRSSSNKEEVQKCIRRSQSVRAMPQWNSMQTIQEEARCSKDILKNSHILSSSTKQNYSTPKPADLQKRLIKWLQKQGKAIDNFKNLHKFGINNNSKLSTQPVRNNNTTITVSNNHIHNIESNLNVTYDKSFDKAAIQLDFDKENMSVQNFDSCTSSSKHNITYDKDSENKSEIAHSTPKTLDAIDEDNSKIAEDVLNDLYDLIIEGYPREQCEQWLYVIKCKYTTLQKCPIFWECKALLESNDGDFQSAIDSYQKAVVEGAEHLSVELKLSKLFDRLGDLNIDLKSLNVPAIANLSFDHRIVDDRNKFASSIIKFAIRQKKHQKKSDEDDGYIATPVRRSSRLWSKTPVSVTPSAQKIQYCNSLNSLEAKMRRRITFTPNAALLDEP